LMRAVFYLYVLSERSHTSDALSTRALAAGGESGAKNDGVRKIRPKIARGGNAI